MKFLSNAHTHSTYCDGLNTVKEMVATAKSLGFVSLGFSGHAYQGFDFDYCMNHDAQLDYLYELQALQQEYLAREEHLRLWKGLEEDGMAEETWKRENDKQFDYIITSTHYLCKDFHGKSVAVDGDRNVLDDYVREVLDGDVYAMVHAYYDLHVKALIARRPHIIGHFDLVCKYAGSHPGSLFDDRTQRYRQIALEALEAARGCGAVLEVNTGGMARGYRKTPYPSMELLGAWREMGGDITITSDCHQAAFLDYAFDRVQAVLKSLGYKSLRRLGMEAVLWEDIAL